MIIDASALLAILYGEPDARRYASAIEAAPVCRMAAPTWFEAAMNIDKLGDPWLGRRFDDFMAESGIMVVPFGPDHAREARKAWQHYGRGRHKARLNFGDCMVYAVAKVEREPLLFKGDDFTHTDIEPALKD